MSCDYIVQSITVPRDVDYSSASAWLLEKVPSLNSWQLVHRVTYHGSKSRMITVEVFPSTTSTFLMRKGNNAESNMHAQMARVQSSLEKLNPPSHVLDLATLHGFGYR